MAVESDQLKQVVKQLDYYDSDLHVNSALIGSDFLATTIRAWPQFFFAYVLPFPILQAASFAIAGVFWTQRAREYRLGTVLTDEFILSYLALKDNEEALKALDEAEKTKLAEIGAAIKEIEEIKDIDSKRKKDLAACQAYIAIAGNKEKVSAALKNKEVLIQDTVTPKDKQSQIWATGFKIVFQYATAHWVLWMTGTLLFYSKERWEFDNWHGVNEDYHQDYDNNPGNIPGVFENDTYAALQFILPAIIVIGAQIYNWHYKDEKEKQENFTKQQEHVRAEYLLHVKQKEDEKNREAALASSQVDSGITASLIPKDNAIKTNFFNSERWAVILSMGTAFWTAFLIGNLVAWPVTGLLNKLTNFDAKGDSGVGNEAKILTVFSMVIVACVANMYYKYVDMKKELRDAGMNDVTWSTTYAPKQTFWQYYGENWRTGVNIVLDRVSGSGGILAMRFVFMGGIGGYAWDKNDTDGMDHIKEVMPIALTAMVLMIALNLYQTYYAAQRGEVLKDNKDDIFRKPRLS
ncbi:MAG: hypothetical protein ACHQAX_05230 [Gammaproteobacteria bacterium]